MEFLLRVEDTTHTVIPIFIRGDFKKFAAPNGKDIGHRV